MARQRKLSPERKAFIDSLLEHYQPQDAQDVQNMLKVLHFLLLCPDQYTDKMHFPTFLSYP